MEVEVMRHDDGTNYRNSLKELLSAAALAPRKEHAREQWALQFSYYEIFFSGRKSIDISMHFRNSIYEVKIVLIF